MFSAVHPITDIAKILRHVRFVQPSTDIAQKLDARSKEIPSARKALKLVRSAIREFQTCSGHKIGHDPRDKDLVSVGLRHDASRGVHGNTADIPASDFDLTGVKARAQRQTDLFLSRLEGKRASNSAT